jgi:hypothetical protein
MAGKRWTPEEEAEWAAYFSGKTNVYPKGRQVHCAMRRLEPKAIADLTEPAVAHATSSAAMRHLPNLPWRTEGDPVRFIEHVQKCAVEPWRYAAFEYPWPTEVFEEAIHDARAAIPHG